MANLEQTNALAWPITASSPVSFAQKAILAYVRHAPIALCVRELNRLFVYQMLSERNGKANASPVLDVGCGDGFWWELQKRSQVAVYGIDISDSELKQASRRIEAKHVDISKEIPYPTMRFPRIIGNCSMEHVPDIHTALKNLRRTAEDGAEFMLFVPTPNWAYQGYVQTFLLKRAPRLAMTISGALNGFFQHWHLYEPSVWNAILNETGWEATEIYGLGSARSEFLYRLFLPPAFLSFLGKKLFGKYPNRLLKYVPAFLLYPYRKLLTWALENPLVSATDPRAYERVIVAKAK